MSSLFQICSAGWDGQMCMWSVPEASAEDAEAKPTKKRRTDAGQVATEPASDLVSEDEHRSQADMSSAGLQ